MIRDTSRAESCSTHDGACTACRARKIKCGREKPRCGSCMRDKAECSYSPPPKRVNYVKVLCQNVDDIQGRLIAMQGELSLLTTALKNSAVMERPELDGPVDPSRNIFSPSISSSLVPPGQEELGASSTALGHVIRDGTTQVERYYGPWTLVALCRDFSADLASCVTTGDACDDNNTIGDMLANMAAEMIHSTSSLDHGPRAEAPTASWSNNIDPLSCLPPRQLLSMTLDSFLKNVNYNTDIFNHKAVSDAVERVYSKPQSDPSSETWAVCFNLIILLVIGADKPLLSDDPFVRPLLQAVHAAAQKRSFFTAPSLVGIQTLALLSLLMQQHYPDEPLGDYAFVQACTLARQAGLHQHSHDAPRPHLAADETTERLKMFRSLYARDRYAAMLRGSPTWLPGAIPSRSKQTQEFEASPVNWQLAYLQDEILRSMTAMEATGEVVALSELLQRLDSWGKIHITISFTEPISVNQLSLQLAFLGTRIRLNSSLASLRGSTPNETSPAEEELRDARLACLLLVKYCSGNLSGLLEDLARSLVRKGPEDKAAVKVGTGDHPSAAIPSPGSSPSASENTDPTRYDKVTAPLSPSNSSPRKASMSLKILSPHHIVSVFPSAAPFALARHILNLRPDIPTTEPRISRPFSRSGKDGRGRNTSDIALLRALLACFRIGSDGSAPVTHRMPRSDQRWQIGRVIEYLLQIITCIQEGPKKESLGPFVSVGDAETYESMSFEPGLPLIETPTSLPMNAPDLYHQICHPMHAKLATDDGDNNFWIMPNYNNGHDNSNTYSGTSTPLQGSSYTFSSSFLQTPPPLVPTNTPGDFNSFMDAKCDPSNPLLWWNGDGNNHDPASHGQIVQPQPREVTPHSTRQTRKRARVDKSDV